MESEKFLDLADRLAAAAEKIDGTALDALESAAEQVGKAWSGSWLGYHSRVYYKDLAPVPAGARFSKEWGIEERFAVDGTVGEWREFEFDGVVEEIRRRA